MTKYCSSNSSVIFPLWNKKYFNQKLPTQQAKLSPCNSTMNLLISVFCIVDVLVLGRLTCSTLLEPPSRSQRAATLQKIFGPNMSRFWSAYHLFKRKSDFHVRRRLLPRLLPTPFLKTMVEFRGKKLEQCS